MKTRTVTVEKRIPGPALILDECSYDVPPLPPPEEMPKRSPCTSELHELCLDTDNAWRLTELMGILIDVYNNAKLMNEQSRARDTDVVEEGE